MNDFSDRLTVLLDEVAAGIQPRPDFDAIGASPVPVVGGGEVIAARFRRPLVAAAAAVLVVAGGVAAYQVLERDSLGGAADRNWPGYPEFDDRPVSWPEDPMSPAPVVAVPAADIDSETDEEAAAVATPEVEATVVRGALVTDGERVTQQFYGTAPDGTVITATIDGTAVSEVVADNGLWRLDVDLSTAERGVAVPIGIVIDDGEPSWFEVTTPKPTPTTNTTTAPTTTKPAPPPETTVAPKSAPTPTTAAPKPQEPAPIPFTAHAVDPYQDETYLKHSFYGTAPVGAKVVVASDWGSIDGVADGKGEWALRLTLTGVPDGKVVVVTVTASTGGTARFELVRRSPTTTTTPTRVEFTSQLGDVYDNADYFKPVLSGTAAPGSTVVANSNFGSASTKADAKGRWEIWFKLFDVPNGPVGVWVTNSVSPTVFEYDLVRRNAPDPNAIEFTVAASCYECARASNGYWGTGRPGSVVTITSPYGGGQVTVGESGGWEIGVEFPGAPVAEKFWVKITNSASAAVFEKPMKVVGTG